MKKLLFLLTQFFTISYLCAQVSLPAYPDSIFSTYYHQRKALFDLLPQTKEDIVFIGNSITDGGEWGELFNDTRIKNRGISGDISAGVIMRIDEVVKRKPSKVFLMIGVNDLARGVSVDSVVKNILLITDYLYEQSPSTKLFVQGILPVNHDFGRFGSHTSKSQQIKQVNGQLQKESKPHRFTYINLYLFFCDDNEKLSAKYTNDGLHLIGDGYLLWKHLVFPYVYDLQEKPSLIPWPQKISWNEGCFPLYQCQSILISQNELEQEANQLKMMIHAFGWNAEVKSKVTGEELHIELQLNKHSLPSDEAYKLIVSKRKILVSASSKHGIFNGLQTLNQLMRDGIMVDACEITDWPAFSWRGYMIDVGRNYMSVDLLKQQIDLMSRYKMNVFHFHATEDIAWRISIKQYPQLTSPETMLRNKGLYYTEREIRELINYCKERHITFVPEIDMPGHSAAFKRAMGADMQSDSGLRYVRNILKEFCETYDVPYIHIGADEVKITNKNFIPDVTSYIESFGKKVIGWQPGGNFSDNTLRQLWMDDNGKITRNDKLKFIDSRHLYLNHMDPLESVVTIFNRKLCDRDLGDSSALGATLCMWHDRAAAKEEDVLRMNPVYPGMLAFAERSWRGGGKAGWVANISDGDTFAFAQFENRLLDNRQLYFSDKPFGYSKQASLQWKLYGPYPNEGDLTRKFDPESKTWDKERGKAYKVVIGGTVVLRHWWAPLIKGAINEPKENSTWYATTKIWIEEEGEKDFWIGFNNLSRSPATDSPPQGVWDNRGSSVWVNGRLIEPPKWKRGGQKGNSEIPLIDESYEYREPNRIYLKKGWNNVLVKCPIGTFKGKDWQNPVKWMFTFLPLL